MPRKTEGRGAFVKFDLTPDAWQCFKASCQYYRMTRAEMLREFVDRWNQDFLSKIEEGLINPAETVPFDEKT